MALVPLFFSEDGQVPHSTATSMSVTTAVMSPGAWSRMTYREDNVGAAAPLAIQAEKAGRYNITVELDDRFRPHSGTGKPSVERDEAHWWHWHGVEVPERIVTKPETITVAEIDEEKNAEVRRVMIERYGQARYLVDCGAKRIQQDECGELYEKRFKGHTDNWHGEPLKFVKVKNSTAEPDGTFKDYFLRVPSNIGTARAGIAWTFGLREKEYQPELQS